MDRIKINKSEELKKNEKQILEAMVIERTEALELELADRKKAENKLITSLDKITRNRQAILNLMEDLKEEINERKLADEKLKYERNLLRTLIDNIPDTIFVLDEKGRKIIANKADVDIIGYESEADIFGKTDEELFPGETGKRFHKLNLSVIRSGKATVDQQEEFIDKSGENHWFQSSYYPLIEQNGNVSGLVGVGHDITERKKTAEDLTMKNKELHFLNTLATELNTMDHGEDLIIFLLSRLKTFTGSQFAAYSEYDSLKNNLITRHIEADQKLLKKFIKIVGNKILNNQTPLNLTREIFSEIVTETVTEKKSLREISFGAVPELIDQGVSRFTGFNRYFGLSFSVSGQLFGTAILAFRKDQPSPSKELLKSFAHIAAVSLQRRKAEEMLKLSEEKYRLLIENQGEGVSIIDLKGTFIFANPAAEEMFGVVHHDLVNRNLSDFIPQDQFLITIAQNEIRQKTGKSTFEIEIKRPNGEICTILVTATSQFNNAGVHTGTFGVFRDISDRKKAEQDLIIAKDKAEESDRLKTAFLHNISHEIRTPMNAIVGFSSMLGDPDLDQEARKSYTEVITQSSDHLLSIITDIVDISNIEANLVKTSKNEICVNATLKSLYDQFIPKAEGKKISISLKPGLPDAEALILTDNTKLIQIMSNLISNAVKFTESGEIRIEYFRKGDFLEFCVTDTGIGIPKEHHARIFDRFYQAHSSDTRLYEGTGLGLAISRAYVKLLGGDMWLVSEPGKGTSFFFTIPYETCRVEINEKAVIESSENFVFSSKKTILIAEDVDSNFKLISFFLSRANTRIIRAVNGREAVEKALSEEKIDLILMDIKMPIMDGYTATRIIREHDPFIPIIAQTAYSEDRNKSIEFGCSGFISKPFDKKSLFKMLKEYI